MIDGGSIMNRAVKLIASSTHPSLPLLPGSRRIRTRYYPSAPTSLDRARRITNGPMMNTRFSGSPTGPTHIVGTHLPSGADAAFSSLIKYSLYPGRMVLATAVFTRTPQFPRGIILEFQYARNFVYLYITPYSRHSHQNFPCTEEFI